MTRHFVYVKIVLQEVIVLKCTDLPRIRGVPTGIRGTDSVNTQGLSSNTLPKNIVAD